MALTLVLFPLNKNISTKTKNTRSENTEKTKDAAARLSLEVCHDTSHVSALFEQTLRNIIESVNLIHVWIAVHLDDKPLDLPFVWTSINSIKLV